MPTFNLYPEIETVPEWVKPGEWTNVHGEGADKFWIYDVIYDGRAVSLLTYDKKRWHGVESITKLYRNYLREVEKINEEIVFLANKRQLLIDEAYRNGARWKDFVETDKIIAIRFYKKEHGCALLEAKLEIEKYLAEI